MIRSGTSLKDRRRASPLRIQDASFHYEVINLTSYGGNTDFPILTEATLCDLRITHRHADGTTVEVPLHDASGLRQVDLDSASVYLTSEEIRLPEPDDHVDVGVAGYIRPVNLSVSLPERPAGRSVLVTGSFCLETILVPGLYELLHVADGSGRRYPIGTIAMVISDPALETRTFAQLRRSANRSLPAADAGSRLRRSSVR